MVAAVSSVVLLKQHNGDFEASVLLSDVRRVVDVQPADFDGDGDVDLAVAVFGYLRGQVLWLENLADGTFRDHQLLAAPGTIHVPIADFDNDGDQDIAAVVSQDEEEVWVFENTGTQRSTNHAPQQFQKHKVFQSINYDLGTAGLVRSDLDQDGDIDLLLPVGDNLEDRYSHGQPYHGCIWLENKGRLKFEAHRVCQFNGTYAADVADMDGDADNDIVLVSMINDWGSADGHSLIWLENDGQQSFTKHVIANRPIQLVTVACGDINGDGRNDIVAGGLHVFRPYDRRGRVSAWTNVNSTTFDSTKREPLVQTDANVEAPSNVGDKQGIPIPNLAIEDKLTRAGIEASRLKLAALQEAGSDRQQDWMQLGKIYFAYGFFDSALGCFREAITRDSTSAEAKFCAGVTLGRLGRSAEAKTELTQAANLSTPPGDGRVGEFAQQCWHELGKCNLRLELADDARAAFERAEDDPRSLLERAKLLIRAEQASDARTLLDQLSRTKHAVTVEYFAMRARAYEAMGDDTESRRLRDMSEYNSRRLPSDPFTVEIQSIRDSIGLARENRTAFELLRRREWSEAVEHFAEAATSGWDQQSSLLHASAELNQGHANSAREILAELIRQCGQFPEALLLLGDTYAETGDQQRAEQIWKECAAQRSGIGLHQRLASIYRQRNDAAAANQQLARLNQTQGIADLRDSKITVAAKSFSNALALDPQLATAWFYLAECHRLLGRTDEAKAAYQQSLKLAPGHGRSFRHRHRLDDNAKSAVESGN